MKSGGVIVSQPSQAYYLHSHKDRPERVIITPLKEVPPEGCLSIPCSELSEKIRVALTQCYPALEYCDKRDKCD